jgi:phospholipid-binding lipoprotein MlaA
MYRVVSIQYTQFVLRARNIASLMVMGFVCTGCATPGSTTGHDPWVGMNRNIYAFNDDLDSTIVKPVAQGYKYITPAWFRGAVGRFFANLEEPLTMANQLMQGKPLLFLQDTGRFITNSTLGVGGLFDVADRMNMPAHDEDFGQTLAVWGVPSGPYFVLPFFGPSTVRDAPSRIPEFLVGDLGYLGASKAVQWGALGLEIIDTRASLLATDATLDSAYDRYGVMRDAWIQRREYLIFDGNPPEEDLEFIDEADMEDADARDATAPSLPEPTPPN